MNLLLMECAEVIILATINWIIQFDPSRAFKETVLGFQMYILNKQRA